MGFLPKKTWEAFPGWSFKPLNPFRGSLSEPKQYIKERPVLKWKSVESFFESISRKDMLTHNDKKWAHEVWPAKSRGKAAWSLSNIRAE